MTSGVVSVRTNNLSFRGHSFTFAQNLGGYYLALPYSIELIPDDDGYWFARIPLLPGCVTQGESREETLVMIDEAKALWLETAFAERIEIPEPIAALRP